MGKWKTKGGGGFLNDVTAVIAGHRFESKEWQGKNGPYYKLSCELQIVQDGATVPVKQFLDAGFFYPENQSISADGLTLSSDRDGVMLDADTEFARFIDSLETVAPELAKAFEASNYRNFTAMNGSRVTFKRVIDEEATKKFGKRKGKDKDGNDAEFNRDNLLVGAYVGKVDVKGGGSKPAAAKTTKATASKPASAPATTPAAPAATVDTARLDEVMTLVLADAPNSTIARTNLNSTIVRFAQSKRHGTNGDAQMDPAEREAIRTALTDAYLQDATARGALKFDGKQISL
jgi:hypothetical protein